MSPHRWVLVLGCRTFLLGVVPARGVELVLLVPVRLPGLGVVLLAPCDFRAASRQTQQVKHGSSASESGAHVQWDQSFVLLQALDAHALHFVANYFSTVISIIFLK